MNAANNQAIPIQIASSGAKSHTIGGGTRAILFELAAALRRLDGTGEGTAIDLKSLPMAPDEFNELKHALGRGELELELDIDGTTQIRETAHAGIWWIQHKNRAERVISEYIEVNRFPEFLAADPEQIQAAAHKLEAQCKEHQQ